MYEVSKADDVYAFSVLAAEVSDPVLSGDPQYSSGFLCTRELFIQIIDCSLLSISPDSDWKRSRFSSLYIRYQTVRAIKVLANGLRGHHVGVTS